MKRIKFRVWCKNKKEWEKDLCFISQTGILYHVDGRGVPQPTKPGTHIVSQYIGVQDTHGVDICEGDIVKSGDNIGTVEFFKDSYAIKLTKPLRGISPPQIVVNLSWTDLEIIGNIHENPELLEAR